MRVLPTLLLIWLLTLSMGCPSAPDTPDDTSTGDGPVASGISSGVLGEPLPTATTSQLEAFERGKAVFQKRFDLADGLGPAFNVSFCGGCHERPVPGGSAGLYRNFFLAGRLTQDGAFLASESAGMAGGVLRVFSYGDESPVRPDVPADTDIFTQRNPIPFFGAGLLAELSDTEILSRADADDLDGDGISGRANFDQGFVGRFGRKSQTVSIEGFIRGPLFNHIGITSDPLTETARALLPVDSSAAKIVAARQSNLINPKPGPHMQAAAPDAPTTDDDDAPDPELGSDDLFDLVSFVMLMGSPQLEALTEQTERGRLAFHEANCSACHTPRLEGPRGPIPTYSDLLLHDMGSGLADGVVQGEASGTEFRTQPLWGLAATGPYLHDGRAETLEEAILAHEGEALVSRDAFTSLGDSTKSDLLEFLLSLGGRDQFSPGLVPPGAAIPAVGEYGGPFRELSTDETAMFQRGRGVFDHDFGHTTGVGALTGADGGTRFNGDSCRACHFDPVIGGSGPRGVDVMRHGTVSDSGDFSAPLETPNTILHKEAAIGFPLPKAETAINVLEHRQTPHTFGLGMIDAIDEATILALADPNDANDDGISGRAHVLSDNRIGRLGWKAQVPSVAEFVRDAMAAEIGLTLPAQTGLTMGITEDSDATPDPELTLQQAEDLAFFITMLAPPPRQPATDTALVSQGETVFDTVGCTGCHIPSIESSLGDVALYSDLLLHEILADGVAGIEDGDAGQREFRTAPLWGISQTAPYLHTGEADTLDEAIRAHDGEAAGVRGDYEELSQTDRDALLAFLSTL